MDNLCLLCASIGSGSQVNVLDNEYSLQRVNDVLNLSVSLFYSFQLNFIKN